MIVGTLLLACGGEGGAPEGSTAGSGNTADAAPSGAGGMMAGSAGTPPAASGGAGQGGTSGASSSGDAGAGVAGTLLAGGSAGSSATNGGAAGSSASDAGAGAGGSSSGSAGLDGGAAGSGTAGGGAGSGGASSGGSSGSAALSFAADIWPMFEAVRDPVFVYLDGSTYESCVTGGVCHGGPVPGARLSMPDAETAYEMLLGVPSRSELCAGTTRVVPGNPEQSCLILFYEGRLREELAWVDSAEIDRVRQWIAEGAAP